MRRSYGTLKQNSLCATHEMSLRDMNSTEEVLLFLHSCPVGTSHR